MHGVRFRSAIWMAPKLIASDRRFLSLNLTLSLILTLPLSLSLSLTLFLTVILTKPKA